MKFVYFGPMSIEFQIQFTNNQDTYRKYFVHVNIIDSIIIYLSGVHFWQALQHTVSHFESSIFLSFHFDLLSQKHAVKHPLV